MTLIGRYVLEERLGQGGMGCVWRARDLLLGRQVAIKLTDLAGAARGPAERRLHREAMVISGLTERRLARVFDYFETGEGSFIVMELVQGESLSARVKREGPLPLADAVGIVAECAEALHAAHRAGVVHRDVKPSNIMLTGPSGRDVKIVDFGIAARTRPAAGCGARAYEQLEAETETMTGNIVGTIAYLAPERITGAPDSPAGDLYSLGVVFYQLLSGRLPIEATEPIAMLCAHADGRVEPLPAHIPPAVAELCFRLLARDPADRPPSGAFAAAQLRALDLDHPERLWSSGYPAGRHARTTLAASGPALALRERSGGRQIKALVAAVSLATMAAAGGTAWLVTGFDTQAAAGAARQNTTSAPSTAPASASSNPAHVVSAVVPTTHSPKPGVTTPAAHAASVQGVTDGKGAGPAAGNGGPGHDKKKHHG
ncbi:serine/threonine protein kinase [Actinocrinis puniceicyclus]|uniref:Serine/threonine protein kinase n=1 Tax=Actinocrinis puniceicyclus TaxID=977794 RepID=A0A8J7WMC1_9ACTN|nr:serine/threonine-protein kinase [Actinocrinis puniceicyclus]MBS2963425.1 serine/threonine protein kinase [Actinocrinis puniceicyclus]